MDENSAQILAKNIWELEAHLSSGQATPAARLSLLKAYALQVDHMEESLGVPPEARARLQVYEDRRDGVLLLHGSTGTPADLRELAEHLHRGGFTVYNHRLPSHGLPGASLEELSWESALLDAQNRYRMLSVYCQNLYVVGFSLGGALALHLDVEPRPRALLLLAPALFPRLGFWQRLLTSLGLDRLPFFRRQLGWDGEVLAAMESARRQKWWHEVPLLAIGASDDPRIDPRSVDHLQSRATHRESEFLRLPRGGHMVHHGEGRDRIFSAALEFIKKN